MVQIAQRTRENADGMALKLLYSGCSHHTRPNVGNAPRRGAGVAIVLAALFVTPAFAAVTVQAPKPLDELIRAHVRAPAAEARGAALEAYARDVRRTATGLLATEGYFAPQIDVTADPGDLRVAVSPGTRTSVGETGVEIRGEIPPERREELIAAWPLKTGQPFRDADWRAAKQLVLRRLLEVDFPTAKLVDSTAEIDPETSTAHLHVIYETGPRYIFNGLRVTGLSRYSPSLIEGYNKIRPGSRYEQKALLDLQAQLQRTPYFTSASVEIGDPAEEGENPADDPVRAPINVHVRETPPHRLSFGTGYNTNTGAQGEVVYNGLILLQTPLQFQTGLRLEQRRQTLFADIHLPPNEDRRDSFGLLSQHEDIAGLKRKRIALAAVRTQVRGSVEARYSVNWQRELQEPDNAPSHVNRALTLDGSWIVRKVDTPLNPRRGFVAQLQVGGGAKAFFSDQNFVRVYSRYQHYFPVGERDVFTLRGELGRTFAPDRSGIPGEFLFRTGGAQSVRGYSYQSLGVKEGTATVGGRYLATASAEYIHWLTPAWGGAVFVDAGDASDTRQTYDAAVGYGFGIRWKSPAGPLAVDLAYGERDQKMRLHFSLAVAF